MLSVRNAQCKRYDKTWFVNCCHTFCSNNFVCSFIVTWRLLTRLLIRFLRKLVARYMKHKECIWDWLLLILQDAKDKKYSFFAQFYCKSKKEKMIFNLLMSHDWPCDTSSHISNVQPFSHICISRNQKWSISYGTLENSNSCVI